MTAVYMIDHHFKNKSSVVREIHDTLIRKVKSFGEVREEAHKTSIHLLNQTAFAGIATRKDYLLLTLKTDHRIESSRVIKTEQASRNRFHLLIRLEKPE